MTDFVTGRDTTAEQLLWLLNNRQPVPLDRTRFAVITGTYTPQADEPADWPFQRGEIIPVAYTPARWDGDTYIERGDDQEVFGQRRSFEPWDMFHAVYITSDVLDAVEVAELAVKGLDGFYEHAYGNWRLASDQVKAERVWCSTLEPLRIGDYPREQL